MSPLGDQLTRSAGGGSVRLAMVIRSCYCYRIHILRGGFPTAFPTASVRSDTSTVHELEFSGLARGGDLSLPTRRMGSTKIAPACPSRDRSASKSDVGTENNRPCCKARYYVDLPEDIGKVSLILADAPQEVAQGRDATQLTQDYLARVKAVVREARDKFAPSS